MILIDFEGWFQCRLATDPDPTDEPRGVSGFTFAMPGEPDLDRVIRFHNPVAPRSHGPRVGVFVTAVMMDGELLPQHPLMGGPVELLGSPRFESRNYILHTSGQGIIEPFHLRISGGGLSLEKEDILYPPDPGRKLHRIPMVDLLRRASLIPLTVDRIRVADATGIRDPLAYRRNRKALLEADLERTRDPMERAGLEKRLEQLSLVSTESLQVATLMLYNDFRFDLRGQAILSDPERLLGKELELKQEWPIAFWMGGWDSDALCGFVRGSLSIPTTGMNAS
jgi:hypothetical protein